MKLLFSSKHVENVIEIGVGTKILLLSESKQFNSLSISLRTIDSLEQLYNFCPLVRFPPKGPSMMQRTTGHARMACAHVMVPFFFRALRARRKKGTITWAQHGHGNMISMIYTWK